jgi:hypothetical protein
MRFKIVGASLALVAAVLAAPLAQAEDEGVYENLIDQKMASIVSVKLVLSVKVSHSGQVIQEQDANIAATGVVVDASGLVMLPVSTFEPPIPRRMRRQFEIQSTPSSLRVPATPRSTTRSSAPRTASSAWPSCSSRTWRARRSCPWT